MGDDPPGTRCLGAQRNRPLGRGCEGRAYQGGLGQVRKETTMAQGLAELETAPDVVEATVNYINNNGERLFTFTGGPGSTDKRSGGQPDPHKVKMHNGRLEVDR